MVIQSSSTKKFELAMVAIWHRLVFQNLLENFENEVRKSFLKYSEKIPHEVEQMLANNNLYLIKVMDTVINLNELKYFLHPLEITNTSKIEFNGVRLHLPENLEHEREIWLQNYLYLQGLISL